MTCSSASFRARAPDVGLGTAVGTGRSGSGTTSLVSRGKGAYKPQTAAP